MVRSLVLGSIFVGSVALEAPLANCNDADTTKWNADKNHAQWQVDMTSCGTKCLGRHDCVVTCMEGKSWSDGCAGCWGDLQQCTATHCLAKCIGGRTPDCVTCLKAAGCDTKAFGAGSCTGFDAPTMALEAPLANCNDADTAKWNADKNHAQWQADMTSCGTKCLGRHDCVVTCMEGKSWSDGCAGCWGDLQQCTATHCLAKCIGGRTPDCVTCLKAAGCDTKAFGAGSCTGFAAPTMALEAPLANCNDADTAKWNADKNHAQWQADMTSCGTKCLGRHDCVVTCMEGRSWSVGCAGCWGDLQQCTATHCLAKCIGGRTPDCVSCLKAAGCDTKAFGAGSCTGFDAPSMVVKSIVV